MPSATQQDSPRRIAPSSFIAQAKAAYMSPAKQQAHRYFEESDDDSEGQSQSREPAFSRAETNDLLENYDIEGEPRSNAPIGLS
jgi:hypothetical protein